ncbi:hypothetical protein [Nonomuraea endophytica]|uniref:hypothetical protein n=1 Tax=Nonomuraea endophytica TaxID=714136 RepID=UPI0037CA2410
MTLQDAARALGLAPGEVAEVAETEHGTVARLTTGGTRLITPSDGVYTLDDHPSGKHLRRWTAPELEDGGQEDEDEEEEDGGGSGSTGDTPADGGAVPAGTVEEVLAWVGDDHERAAQALAAERAKERPRSTLVARLTELVEDE